MIQGLANLLAAAGGSNPTSSSSSSQELSESLAGLLLDTLVFAVKLNDQILAQYEHILTPLLLNVWGKFAADMYIVESLKDLFTSISKNTYIYSEFEKRILSSFSPLLEQGLAVAVSEETVDSPLPFPSIMFAGAEVHADLVSSMTWVKKKQRGRGI